VIRGSLITDESEVDSIREDWDELAVGAEIPFGAPAWAEAWWCRVAPAQVMRPSSDICLQPPRPLPR